MADLFDMNVGGVGFHLTSHVIALAALFIACFAIAGYITFRNDSIPGDALKDHDANFEDVTADSLALGGVVKTHIEEVSLVDLTPAATDNVILKQLTLILPATSQILESGLIVTELGSNTALTVNLTAEAASGIAAGTAALVANEVCADLDMSSGGTLNDTSAKTTLVDPGARRYLYIKNAAANTATKLTSGKVKVYVKYFGAL